MPLDSFLASRSPTSFFGVRGYPISARAQLRPTRATELVPSAKGTVSQRFLSSLKSLRPLLEPGQVARLVSESCRVRPRLPRDKPPRVRHLTVGVQLWVTTSIEADRSFQHSAVEIEADELALFERSADHELVPLAR